MADDFDTNDITDAAVDGALTELRDQRDEAGDNEIQGEIEVNPQSFVGGTRLVVGPVLFETSFMSRPNITFGDGPLEHGVSAPVEPFATADNYNPFLAHAYVSSWRVTNGVFDGFNLGLYALTTPPGGATRHMVWWKASGKASVYRDQKTDESWTEAYDFNEPDYLVEAADETDYVDE